MVRFADADPQRIAHYPAILVAIHGVSDRFMEAIGFPFWELIEADGFGLPIVEVHAEFDEALRAGDVVTITLRPVLGTRSVRFEYEGHLADGTRAFSAYEQRVCLPVDGDRAIEMPDELREAMAPYAADD
jgi:4-hydroxybenzoyl-CoA thioesterase